MVKSRVKKVKAKTMIKEEENKMLRTELLG